MYARHRIILLLSALLLPSCTYLSGDANVLVTSTPAGADILLNGEDTGRTTPTLLELGGIAGRSHAITVRKIGYEDEVRQVYHYTTGYTSRWIDGAVEPGVWNFPLWWTLGDFFTPFGVRWRYVPGELHVRLHRRGEAPVVQGIHDELAQEPLPARDGR